MTRPLDISLSAIEHHSVELTEQLTAWWRYYHPDREALASVEVPPLLPDPGDRFGARGKLHHGGVVLFSCRVARRLFPLRSRTNVVKFEVLDFTIVKESR